MIGKALYSLDPSAYPALAREGVSPWKIQAVWRSTYFDPDAASLVLPTGVVDPLTGRSYHQIAMASRSSHRSQDMGALQPPGPNETRVSWVEGAGGAAAKDLFDGIDTRLTAIAAGVAEAARRARMEERLRKAEALVVDTRAKLAPATLLASAAPIAQALAELRAARALVSAPAAGTEANTAALLDEKIALAETALATAAEVTIDAVADRETAGPGDPLEVRIGVWNAGPQPIRVESVELESPDGWTLIPLPPGEGKGEPGITPRPVAANALGEWIRKASSPAEPTIPYFLRRPMQGALYDWSDAPPAVRGEPFQPPPLSAVVRLSIAELRSRSRARSSTASATRRSARSAVPCAPFPRSKSRSSRTGSCGPPRRRGPSAWRSRSRGTRRSRSPAGWKSRRRPGGRPSLRSRSRSSRAAIGGSST